MNRRFRALAAAAMGACASASAPATTTAQTTPAIAVYLTDHHFRLSAPVEGGPLVWRVRNDGTEPHQAIVVRLPPGVSEFAERAWLDHGSRGDEPGERVGGIESLAAGAEARFETNLKPGKYILICTMKEEEGRHYDLGMIYRFEIEPSAGI